MGENGKSGTRIVAQRPRSALVLIDDDGIRDAIVGLLGDLGWRHASVETFWQAREAIETDPPGVFIVDPGLHADLLERLIRRLDDRSSVPGVVILSDLPSVATIASDHQVVFVREPFELDELADAIERARNSDAQPRTSRAAGG